MTVSDIHELNKSQVPDACPHCGEKLSPWQQVLLGVDRALICKNCWYRIVLDLYGEDEKGQGQPLNPKKG